MRKAPFAAASLAVIATLLTSACGGGGGGDTSPPPVSKLIEADNVAAFASNLSNGWDNIYLSLILNFTQQSRACQSGSVTFTPDASTASTDDGTVVSDNCRESRGSSTPENYSLVNGRAVIKCTDGAQTADQCRAFNFRLADGVAGSSTVDTTYVASSENVNRELKVKGDVGLSSPQDSTTTTFDIDVIANANDKIRQLAGLASFEKLRLVEAQVQNNGVSRTYDGVFGFTGAQSRCALGKVTFRTSSPVLIGSDQKTLGGELVLSDTLGQSARVAFNSDGSVLVTLSNGQTKTYTRAQLDAIC